MFFTQQPRSCEGASRRLASATERRKRRSEAGLTALGFPGLSRSDPVTDLVESHARTSTSCPFKLFAWACIFFLGVCPVRTFAVCVRAQQLPGSATVFFFALNVLMFAIDRSSMHARASQHPVWSASEERPAAHHRGVCGPGPTASPGDSAQRARSSSDTAQWPQGLGAARLSPFVHGAQRPSLGHGAPQPHREHPPLSSGVRRCVRPEVGPFCFVILLFISLVRTWVQTLLISGGPCIQGRHAGRLRCGPGALGPLL